MFARRILTVAALVTCVFLILVVAQERSEFLIPLIASAVLLIAAFVLQHQLNWWYYRKYPPILPETIHNLFTKTSTFYTSLSREDQKLFGSDVRLFVEAKDFIAKGMDDVPEDAKYMIGYYAAKSTWPGRNSLYSGHDRIVIYPHPFLTPNFPEDVHTVEVEHEDGTLIFSLEHLLASFFNPDKYYPIGMHAFAEILLQTVYQDFPEPPEDFWQKLHAGTAFSKASVLDFIGLPNIDLRTVMFTFYLHNPKKMQYNFKDLPVLKHKS